MKIKLLFILAGLSLSAFGQGAPFGTSRPTQAVASIPGQTAKFIVVLPNATMHICTRPANSANCTNFATTYTDATLSASCPTNRQVVLANTNTCVATSDSTGMWNVWLGNGEYSYTFTSTTGANYGPWDFTVASSGSGTTASNYQAVLANGVANTARPSLNLNNGTKISVNCVDNSLNSRTDCTPSLNLAGSSAGQPFSVDGSNALTQSAANYDVKAAGLAGDMCAQIALAFANAPNSTIDARGFTGDQACASNMFGSSDPSGLLLLGSVIIHAQVPQVRPSRMIGRGIGWKVSTTDANTVIRACSGGSTGVDATCGGVTLANATNVARPTIVCSGKGGVCGANTTFGNRWEYVTFDGNGLANVTLNQDYISQESSGCQYCNFLNYGNSGIGLDVGGGGPKSQNASFDHLYFAIPNVGSAIATCTNAAVPIVINTGGAGNPGPRRVSDVTIDNHGCNYAGGAAGVAPFPIDDIQLSGTSIHLEDIHGEYAAVLLRVAGSATSNTLVINDISSANMQTTSGSHAVCNGLDTQTSTFTVILDSANTYQNINAFGMKANSPGTATYVMNDCTGGANGLITSGAGESNGLALYTIGPVGKNVNINSAVASIASMPGFTWGVETMTANAAAPVPNCQAGNVHRESTNANVVPGAPINCGDGQIILFQVATAGAQTITFSNAAYVGGVLMTGAAAKRCTEEFTWDTTTSKAYFVSGGTCN